MPRTAARSDPARAPQPLVAIQDLLNTLHVERGTDELIDPSAARTWLLDAGYVLSDELSRDDLDRLRALRAALRDLVASEAAMVEGGHQTSAAERLVALASAAAYVPEVRLDGRLWFRAQGHGINGVIGALTVAMHEAQHDGAWQRLKICRNDGCAWAFYDYSRNHSGTWCAMGICGNRTKVARHRARQRQAPSSQREAP